MVKNIRNSGWVILVAGLAACGTAVLSTPTATLVLSTATLLPPAATLGWPTATLVAPTSTRVPPTPTPTHTPTPTPTPMPDLLFFEDFTDSSVDWGIRSGDDSKVQYLSGKLSISVYRKEMWAWATAVGLAFSDVYIVTTVVGSGAPAEIFGILCNYSDNRNFYSAGIDSDGFYIIDLMSSGQTVTLSSGLAGTSNPFVRNADSYQLALRCARNQLTLYVDGQEIVSITDTTHTTGEVGLFNLNFGTSKPEVLFDDFRVYDQ